MRNSVRRVFLIITAAISLGFLTFWNYRAIERTFGFHRPLAFFPFAFVGSVTQVLVLFGLAKMVQLIRGVLVERQKLGMVSSRLFALIMDSGIALLASMLTMAVFSMWSPEAGLCLATLVGLSYMLMRDSFFGKEGLGKRWMHIHTVNRKNSLPCSVVQSILRNSPTAMYVFLFILMADKSLRQLTVIWFWYSVLFCVMGLEAICLIRYGDRSIDCVVGTKVERIQR